MTVRESELYPASCYQALFGNDKRFTGSALKIPVKTMLRCRQDQARHPAVAAKLQSYWRSTETQSFPLGSYDTLDLTTGC